MFTIEEIARATGGQITGKGPRGVEGVSTDSRTVEAGQLFVPLRGATFDGHEYISAAMDRGVRAILAQRSWPGIAHIPAGTVCVAVPDTLRALGNLAAFHRSRFSIPVIGVTGSNGKTTTKEMLGSILSKTGPGLKTTGNLNNLIGLPQMLFKLTEHHMWAVLEMGMSEPGEIDRLAEIAGPRIGIITNAFPAHLESMGTVGAVAAAKGELFRRLPLGGCAVFNADDALIAAQPSPPGVMRLSFGLNSGEITASAIKSLGTGGQRFTLHLPEATVQVELKAFGRHNVSNALAAAAAAVALGVEVTAIRDGLEDFTPYDKRFNLEQVKGIILIDDSYNANPASMEAALVTLRELKGAGRAIAVLGDMLELGAGSQRAHEEMGRIAAGCIDCLIAAGAMAGAVADAAQAAGLDARFVRRAADNAGAAHLLREMVRKGDYVLVKGSRGMRMEKVAEELRNGPPPQEEEAA